MWLVVVWLWYGWWVCGGGIFFFIIVAEVLDGFDMEFFFWDNEFMTMGCGDWFC